MNFILTIIDAKHIISIGNARIYYLKLNLKSKNGKSMTVVILNDLL